MKLKKTLAILMVLAMLVVGAPITAIAAGGVCSIGGVSYSSINEAVAAAPPDSDRSLAAITF